MLLVVKFASESGYIGLPFTGNKEIIPVTNQGILDRGGLDQIFIGEIIESYCEEKYLTAGTPDLEKIKPAVFSMYDNRYFAIGEYLGKAWSIGKSFKPENST